MKIKILRLIWFDAFKSLNLFIEKMANVRLAKVARMYDLVILSYKIAHDAKMLLSLGPKIWNLSFTDVRLIISIEHFKAFINNLYRTKGIHTILAHFSLGNRICYT